MQSAGTAAIRVAHCWQSDLAANFAVNGYSATRACRPKHALEHIPCTHTSVNSWVAVNSYLTAHRVVDNEHTVW